MKGWEKNLLMFVFVIYEACNSTLSFAEKKLKFGWKNLDEKWMKIGEKLVFFEERTC